MQLQIPEILLMKKYYYKKKNFLIAFPQEQDFNLPFIEPTVHVYNDNNHYFFKCFSRGAENKEHRSDHSYEIVVSLLDP